jgi:hypothetical protein
MFSNAELPQNYTALTEAHKLANPAHVFIQPYAKSENNEGTIPAAIKSGRLLDVPLILWVFIFKLVSLCFQCNLMHATLVRPI